MKDGIIKTKLRFLNGYRAISRPGAEKKLINALQSYPVVYLVGGQAIGKTTIIRQTAAEYPGACAVCTWDERDNEYGRFWEYLCAMLQPWLGEYSCGCVQELLLALQEISRPVLIIWEDIDTLREEKILESIREFLNYLPENFCVLMSGGSKLPQSWYPMLWKGRIGELNADFLLFDEREIQEYFAVEGREITRAQAREIKRLTEGWPGIVKLLAGTMHGKQGDSYFLEFVRVNLWDKMTEQEKNICRLGTYFGCVSEMLLTAIQKEEICQEFLGELHRRQILCTEELTGVQRHYRINGIVQHYIRKTETGEEREFLNRYGKMVSEVYLSENRIGDALEVLVKLEDKRMLVSALKKYYKKIPFNVTAAVVFGALGQLAEEETSSPEIWYLKGMCGNLLQISRESDAAKEALEACMQREESGRRKQEIGEMLLNLLYADVRLDMERFLEAGEKIAEKAGKGRLFSTQGNCCQVLFGLRDFTGTLELETAERMRLETQWKRIWQPESSGFWDAAAGVFANMTGARKKTPHEMAEWKQKSPLMLLEFLYDYERDFHETDSFDDYITAMEEQIVPKLDVRETEIFQAQQALRYAWKNEKGRMALWLRMTETLDYEKVSLENAYRKFVRAHGYLMFAQYQRAVLHLEELNSFYLQCGWKLAASQCAFPLAVALYELGEKKEALKKTIESLAEGGRCRDYFLYYGKTGKKLLMLYLEQVAGAQKVKGKKAYVGINPRNSSMAGYVDSLIAESEVRYPDSPYNIGTDMEKKNKLTMTEIMVLQMIAEGKSNQEIAESMEVKITTVKSHAYSLFQKLGVRTRARAVAAGKEEGYIN